MRNKIPHTSPSYHLEAFSCPHCSAYSKMRWNSLSISTSFNKLQIKNLDISFCDHCGDYSIWKEGELIYPDIVQVEKPNSDLPKKIQRDYIEASNILNKSSRSACALLRLAIAKLCIHLGEKGKNLNIDISNLVKKGLPSTLQQAFDLVRITGNSSVHPAVIDEKDNKETAIKMFRLINIITEKLISEPNEIQKLYDQKLTDDQTEAINDRDI